MNHDELRQAIAIADTSNNEGTRLSMKIDAILEYLLSPSEPVADSVLEADVHELRSAAVEAVLIGGDVQQTRAGGYANHASEAPSTAIYDVMPERKKLERMTVEDLKALAARHGIALADGTKATIIDSMIGPEASEP